jgi:hypothetical protein
MRGNIGDDASQTDDCISGEHRAAERAPSDLAGLRNNSIFDRLNLAGNGFWKRSTASADPRNK